MASQTSFKQACPSCEHGVVIRDPKFIGRKVECPKCKYKFVVEDPDADNPSASSREKAMAKTRKTAAANTTLYIGLGIGTAAVLVLVVGAILMFGGGTSGSRSSQPIAPSTRTFASTSPDADGNDPNAADPTNDDSKNNAAATQQPAATPASPRGGPIKLKPDVEFTGEITNILPNDTQSVLDIRMDRLRYSTAGRQAFESRTGFRSGLFQERIGISQDDMARFIRAEHLERGWAFNVIHTQTDINVAAVQNALQPKRVRQGVIKGRPYFEVAPNDLLDSLGQFLKSELEKRDDKAPQRNKDRDAGPLGMALVSSRTLVIANLDVLEEILQLDLKPQNLSKRIKTDDDQPANPSNPFGDFGRPGGRSFSEGPFRQQRQVGDSGSTDDALATKNTFLTINPALKQMLERLETDQKDPPVASMALLLQGDGRETGRLRELTAGIISANFGLRTLGLSVYKYELEKFHGTFAVEFFNENDAKLVQELLKKIVDNWALVLSAMFRMKIDAEGGDGSSASANPFGQDIQQPQTTPGADRIPGRGGRADAGGGGGQNNPNQPEREPSKLKLVRRGRTIMLILDMNTTSAAHDVLYALTENRVAMMRGLVDMAGTRSRWPQLADAMGKLVRSEVSEEEGGRYRKRADAIPHGTYPRAGATSGRLARNWPPSQRVSWMAGLLPHLGKEDLYQDVIRDQDWQTEVNRKVGAIIVPAFLDPRYPQKSQRATVGNSSIEYAATHFVGVAGVGLDAADYATGDKSVEKKIGLFGYERSVSVKDVTDGAANTILMIQVPPDIPRPWIAGGGATVVGVPENRSIRPFSYRHGNKTGTYVLMLDGTVRFLAADTSDAVFQALCTYKGGEPIEDLEKIAPKVKAGDTRQMKTETEAKDDSSDEPKNSEDKDK